MGSILYKQKEHFGTLIVNGLEAEIYPFENFEFPYKKEWKSQKSRGYFMLPYRIHVNQQSLFLKTVTIWDKSRLCLGHLMTSTLALFINKSQEKFGVYMCYVCYECRWNRIEICIDLVTNRFLSLGLILNRSLFTIQKFCSNIDFQAYRIFFENILINTQEYLA